jgi:hypothetical protein
MDHNDDDDDDDDDDFWNYVLKYWMICIISENMPKRLLLGVLDRNNIASCFS